MFNIFADLMDLYNTKDMPVCEAYSDIASEALDVFLPYSTPAMYGMVATLFSSEKMIAYNLIQNSIDEAKGAARIKIIADRYAPPALKVKMDKHVAEEMKHSHQFLNLLPLTGYTYEREDKQDNKKELNNILDFDDELQKFICRVHSIEIRSWTVLRLYMKVIEELKITRMEKAIAVLQDIMSDEIIHVLYTGEQIIKWLNEDEKIAAVLKDCFAHTRRETWHDLANMSNYFADNFSAFNTAKEQVLGEKAAITLVG